MVFKSRITALLVLLLSSFSFGQVPTENLVGYYSFVSNTEDVTANDLNGILVGGEYVIDRLGNENNALYLDGENDQLLLPLEDYTPLDGDFAFSFWCKTSNQLRSHVISIGDPMDGLTQNLQITLQSASQLLAYWNGFGDFALISNVIVHLNDNKWHHLVFQRNAGNIQMWIDRNLIGMLPWSTTFYEDSMGDDAPVLIGGTDYAYRGAIDDIAFYNAALNQEEIHQLYHDGQPIVVLSPRITDVYPANSYCSFQWKIAAGITSINLEYSLDGTNWDVALAGVTNEYYSYDWPMPAMPVGASFYARISDSNNPQTAVVIGPMRISEYHWEEVNTNCEWLPRDGAGLLSFDNKLWLLGGWNPYIEEWLPGYTCNEVWNSEDGNTWNFVGDAPWAGRHTGGWLVHDDKMWVVGGDWNSGIQQMDVWSSEDGITWDNVLDSIPVPVRMTHMVASLNDEIVYFGGQEITFLNFSGSMAYNDVWSSGDGISWEQKTDSAGWYPRGQVQGHFVRNDTLWLVGGGTYDTREMYSDVWYTADGSEWTRVTEAANFTPRQYHEVCAYDNRLWVLGGYDGSGNLQDVWYSDNGADWLELRNTPWPPRHAGAVCEYDSSLWMVSGNLWNDSWRLVKEEIPATVETKNEEPKLFAYPNPCDDVLHFSNADKNAPVYVYDMNGKLLIAMKNHNGSINVKGLESGIYILESSGNRFQFIRR